MNKIKSKFSNGSHAKFTKHRLEKIT